MRSRSTWHVAHLTLSSQWFVIAVLLCMTMLLLELKSYALMRTVSRIYAYVIYEYIQVKNFGRSGQTKWTHLAAEDTTAQQAPFVSAHLLLFEHIYYYTVPLLMLHLLNTTIRVSASCTVTTAITTTAATASAATITPRITAQLPQLHVPFV